MLKKTKTFAQAKFSDTQRKRQGRSQEYRLGGAGLQQRYTKYNF